MKDTFFSRRNSTDGTPNDPTWGQVCAGIRNEPRLVQEKEEGALIFGEMKPDPVTGTIRHTKDCVVALHALAVDIDDAQTDAVLTAVADTRYERIGWATFGQLSDPKDETLRCRLVFLLSRPVTKSEWPKFWKAAIEHLKLGAIVDGACKNVNRLYFNTCPVGELEQWQVWFDIFRNHGAPLDVDALLANAAEPNTKSGRVVGLEVDLDAPEAIDQGVKVPRAPKGSTAISHAETLARTMPVAPDGQQGGTCLFRVARALVWGLELAPELAAKVILEHYSPRAVAAEYPSGADPDNVDRRCANAEQADGAAYPRGALLPPATTAIEISDEPTIANVADILLTDVRWKGVIRFNELTCAAECTAEPPMRDQDRPSGSCVGRWTEAHTARLRTWISDEYRFEPGVDVSNQAIEIAARRSPFHPVRAYLSAPVWDGTPRIDEWLATHAGVENSLYSRAVGAKFLISAVARAFRPGVKVDTMPIFEGPQGLLKSTLLKTLCGAEFFTDTAIDLNSKDAMQNLQGSWFVEMAELHTFSKADVARIKAFLTSAEDKFRPSYGRRLEVFPRQCVFAGTMNPDGVGYLRDPTGGRRFWPVVCTRIDIEAVKRDRDQLWAEAVARFNAGAEWWLTPQEEEDARAEQEERTSVDPWVEILAARRAELGAEFKMADALRVIGLRPEDTKHDHSIRAGTALRQLGYVRRQLRSGEQRGERVYVLG